jgi:isoquinoline 1-oxidoreductase subunit alpha
MLPDEGPQMVVRFTVNGRPVAVDVSPDKPLLWVLRDELRLKSTRLGCGIALCGTCTVHRDGEPIQACVTQVRAVEGADVRTLEGLSPDGSHPVQRAWEELDVAQCGYCEAGQIMNAAALLRRTPEPTDEEIDAAVNSSLCRCATVLRIREAVRLAASRASTTVGAGRGGR